ncbi:ribonuclease P protein component [Borreliella burgdorferi]|uniref:Ribonuclease P protein component n=2 Tax=Borreliella burgdorferi TaxID=139 RepID=RNPA_BORBZ|nr:ribonuclease P protein component [Borreliella burgdorferi]B7J207.1 RecName: Full=Ribonuclease P protein component; Short=RNase P protein; Short=RNaseP protein; AltName: Full=Protein C5 [Borreliella burgdorferi ZS7]ACK74585.1 ribonuclease P protein component [Borreliella burgdorferi ZS7]ADQ29805.1 ribonuclease P protein component [Borreliella burgdorferi N40]ADQ30954.1 ribonuclease P protein component [Borreliella burgdorferi JD1]ATH09991.1 ribonuclease P protein component [Borreliella burgd
MRKRNISLKSKIEIQKIFKEGKLIRFSNLNLKMFYKSNHLVYSRILVTFSKGFRGSVKRNRIRRLFKEAFRKRLELLEGIALDIIFVVSYSKLTLTYFSIESLMKGLVLRCERGIGESK